LILFVFRILFITSIYYKKIPLMCLSRGNPFKNIAIKNCTTQRFVLCLGLSFILVNKDFLYLIFLQKKHVISKTQQNAVPLNICQFVLNKIKIA